MTCGDGEYLQLHTVSKLLGTLGKPEDDSTNTFTARLIDEAKELGEAMYELLAALGNGSIFYRLLVV